MNYTGTQGKNQNSFLNHDLFKKERNLRVCDLKAQGYSYKMIQKAVYDEFGEFISVQRVAELIKLFKKQFEKEGMI